MGPVLIVVVLGAVALAVAGLVRRREHSAPQQGASWTVPTYLDRNDFDRPDAPWLVAVFSSSTCLACQETWDKASALESATVAVQEVEVVDRKDLHERYGIDAVPLVLLVDAGGIVRKHFVGPPPASELWAAMADLRDAAE